jgi:Tfp pilus assembly protein PilO
MWMELLLKRYFRWTVLVVVLIFVGLGYSFLLASKISAIQTVAVSEKKTGRDHPENTKNSS